MYQDGTFAIRGLTDTREAYWLKVLGNPQGDQVLVTETVVAAMGELIGAPVRPTRLVRIPDALAGWQYGPALRLRPGIAHGSLNLAAGEERDYITYKRRDHNSVRRARLIALWDWCMGGDQQWLYDQENEYSIWSFDHGFWLGGIGEDWTGDELARMVNFSWEWTDSIAGIDPSAINEVADRLRKVTPDEVLSGLAGVPTEWGTSDSELETLGWVLYKRAGAVVKRLRKIASSLEQGGR